MAVKELQYAKYELNLITKPPVGCGINKFDMILMYIPIGKEVRENLGKSLTVGIGPCSIPYSALHWRRYANLVLASARTYIHGTKKLLSTTKEEDSYETRQ